MPDGLSQNMGGNISENMLDRMPGQVLEHLPDRLSDRSTCHIVCRTLDDVSQIKCFNVCHEYLLVEITRSKFEYIYIKVTFWSARTLQSRQSAVNLCHFVLTKIFAPCSQANQTHTSPDDVHVVGFVDYNAPGARQASKVDILSQGINLCNNLGASKQNVCMILLPDLARDSSLRGLWDEEKQIIESLFGQKLDVETRFIDLLTREPRSEGRSCVRRWAAGRLVVSSESKNENHWLNSELAVCGRPVGRAEGENGAPCSILPRSSALLLPEGASPDSDLKLADRTRPSPEQTAAQKGQQRLQLLIESLFRHSGVRSPCLVVNLTGYVEELAAAVSRQGQRCLDV